MTENVCAIFVHHCLETQSFIQVPALPVIFPTDIMCTTFLNLINTLRWKVKIRSLKTKDRKYHLLNEARFWESLRNVFTYFILRHVILTKLNSTKTRFTLLMFALRLMLAPNKF